MKSKGVAFLLWLFLGWMGAHRYYLGKTGSAILWTCTGALLGVGWLIDLFLVWGMVDRVNLLHTLRSQQTQNIVVNVNVPGSVPAAPSSPVAPTEKE